jgi:hypothetical protein
MGTPKGICRSTCQLLKSDWIARPEHLPLVTIVQLNNGWVNDRGITTVNGDLFTHLNPP